VSLGEEDLAGIGALDPKTLQDTIFYGRARPAMLGIPSPTAPPRTVTVTLPTGEAIKGKLVSLDDFVVVLTDADGHRRTIQRAGDVPKVDIVNPLQAHLDMVRSWKTGICAM